jgi:hypothetical protein
MVACGAELGDKRGGTGGAGGAAAAAAGGSGNGSANGGSGAVEIDATAGSGGIDECAGETIKGELIPLDMYVMFDTSYSMVDPDPTKWLAVTQALTSFLLDPGSAGLGVGIQYFPLQTPGVPDQCTASADCGPGGICALKTCDGTGFVIPCNTTADCQAGEGNCVDLGVDCLDNTQFCLPPGNTCSPVRGGCVRVAGSYCSNYFSCTTADYATPAVEIAQLPGASSNLINSLNARTPSGSTPTAPALSGGIQHAQAWAQQNAGHRVVVLLATDGLPTECDPQDIPQIAQIAAAGLNGTPSISTFVVGVFAPDEASQAQANLDTIAASGGTMRAFVIDASQNVTAQFLDALNAIRGSSVACEFHVPMPLDGGELDYGKVNMVYTTSSGQKSTLYYVGNQAGCDPQDGGWYYDADPSSGAVPTKMIVCDTNCGVFKTTGGELDVKMGCETVIAPPK